MSIAAVWSNRLEELAVRLFGNLAGETAARPAEVLAARQCVVIPNGIRQYWLQHQYLFDRASPRMRVLANIDFPLLHVFVNDWLYAMDHPRAARDPGAHPFSAAALTWRIYALLGQADLLEDGRFQPLRRYLDAGGEGATRRRRRQYAIAGRLGRLFDEYQVYRPDVLADWQDGRDREAIDPALCWQPELWRRLTAGPLMQETYLSAFRRMGDALGNCGIQEQYRHIHVFGVSILPRAYTVFFDLLSDILPVTFYVFNPCREHWDDGLTTREAAQPQRRARLEGMEEAAASYDAGNQLLRGLGRGCRDFLGEIVDVTGGQIDDPFIEPSAGNLLAHLQRQILMDESAPAPVELRGDGSIQIHVCHSPLREMEVLRDHLLRWFTEDPDLQPRQVQVQVTDLAAYAPYVRAVFATSAPGADPAVPYVIADRVRGGESSVAEVFLKLLELPESRFTAPEVVDLLQCGAIRQAFGLAEADIPVVQNLVTASGIRWGRDADHREAHTGIRFTEHTTWRHGLDRLFLGYAAGRDHDPDPGLPLPCDQVEGDTARVLGRLARLVDELSQTARLFEEETTAEEWAERLAALVDRSFHSTNDTYRNIGVLRTAIDHFRAGAAAAGLRSRLPLAVVRDSLRGELQGVIGGEGLVGNAVVFSALRPGSSAPRRIMCLLGMGDGQFPRGDNRAAYDLLRRARRRGDRSVRVEDRLAGLEALLSARDRLYISYVGRTLNENAPLPPSTIVTEMLDALGQTETEPAVAACVHRLQPFHPEYFRPGSGKFSYDAGNCRAARRLAAPAGDAGARPVVAAAAVPPLAGGETVDLRTLLRFLRNPARAFYTNILRADLEIAGGALLSDREEFVPSGLDGYGVNEAIVDAVVCGRDRDQVYRELSESGRVPLEAWGAQWFAARWRGIETLLNHRIGEAGVLRELLGGQAASEAVLVRVAAGPLTIDASMQFAPPVGSGVAAVDFRYAKPKPVDQLLSWATHLVACAGGRAETRHCVFRGQADAPEEVAFAPLDAARAADLLGGLAELYVSGQARVLPFTPASSYAYAKSWRENPDGPAARAVATRAWESDPENYRFGDDGDVYFRQAFGAAGPFGDPAFGQLARSIFDPLLEALAGGGGK